MRIGQLKVARFSARGYENGKQDVRVLQHEHVTLHQFMFAELFAFVPDSVYHKEPCLFQILHVHSNFICGTGLSRKHNLITATLTVFKPLRVISNWFYRFKFLICDELLTFPTVLCSVRTRPHLQRFRLGLIRAEVLLVLFA